jgi:hypothetical protein
MRFKAVWVNALQRRVVSCKRKVRLPTPSPGPPRLKKTPVRPTLSTKGERVGIGSLGLVVRRLKSVG